MTKIKRAVLPQCKSEQRTKISCFPKRESKPFDKPNSSADLKARISANQIRPLPQKQATNKCILLASTRKRATNKCILLAQAQKRRTNKCIFVPQRKSEEQTKIFSLPNAKASNKQKFARLSERISPAQIPHVNCVCKT